MRSTNTALLQNSLYQIILAVLQYHANGKERHFSIFIISIISKGVVAQPVWAVLDPISLPGKGTVPSARVS